MIEGVDHIGIAVRSIEESKTLYEQLGLAVTHVEEVPQEQVRVAMIPCGETRIELLEPMSDASPIQKFLDKRGPGIHHICMRTDDVSAEDRRLRTSGFQLLRDQPSPGAEGALVQFLHPKTAGGVLLELSEPQEHTE